MLRRRFRISPFERGMQRAEHLSVFYYHLSRFQRMECTQESESVTAFAGWLREQVRIGLFYGLSNLQACAPRCTSLGTPSSHYKIDRHEPNLAIRSVEDGVRGQGAKGIVTPCHVTFSTFGEVVSCSPPHLLQSAIEQSIARTIKVQKPETVIASQSCRRCPLR